MLESLEPADRTLLEWVIVQETSIAEAGRAVELPYGQAHYRFYEALDLFDKRVRAQMKEKRG